jgi:hypothetical protein
VAREHDGEPGGASQKIAVVDALGRHGTGRRRLGLAGRVDDHDRAPGGVGDAVGDVSQQEARPPAHADVSDDEDVGAMVAGCARDRRGRILVHHHHAPAACAGQGLGVGE